MSKLTCHLIVFQDIENKISDSDCAAIGEPSGCTSCFLDVRIIVTGRYFAGGDGLYTPTDLADLFNPPYDAGVRIHSNSWGCDAIAAVLF